jgi:small subunit ribosomal protein S17
MTTTISIKHRKLTGTVMSDKMDKTVVVRVDRVVTHPRYRKQYQVSTRFKAHDEKNEYHVGDRVLIEETRPYSREKRWRVIGKVVIKGATA